MEPSIFFYVELEGEDLDILPLYELFSKYSCYGSHAGDTYYTYDADGTKHAHTRTKPYFQARLEYQSPTENPLNDVACAFLNMFCYEGAPILPLIEKQQVKIWCSVSSPALQMAMALTARTMSRLAALGLDMGVTVVQQGKIKPRT